MQYRAALAILGAAVTHEEVAARIGCSIHSVRQAALPDAARGHRSPPPGWKAAALQLAELRIADLQTLIEEVSD